GRFVIMAPGIGAYRVSSRSFPNRRITAVDDDTLRVEPTPDAEPVTNPYVTYHCARIAEDQAVLGNGAHVDHIAEKLELGYPARDALPEVLLALDYEQDNYDTPRLAGVVGRNDTVIGIVRPDALLVRAVDEPTMVATYELDAPEPQSLDATSARGAARAAYDLDFEYPVCAAGANVSADGIDLEFVNGPEEPQS
ncbi:MAG: IMP cyclohydrolase, partial [Halobacteriales archaeon]